MSYIEFISQIWKNKEASGTLFGTSSLAKNYVSDTFLFFYI
jgi:hypothetical protein